MYNFEFEEEKQVFYFSFSCCTNLPALQFLDRYTQIYVRSKTILLLETVLHTSFLSINQQDQALKVKWLFATLRKCKQKLAVKRKRIFID